MTTDSKQYAEIKTQIDKLGEDTVSLKVEAARQSEQIKSIHSKLDDVADGVKGIRDSLLSTATDSNKFFKSWTAKLALILITSGITGGAVSAVASAFGG